MPRRIGPSQTSRQTRVRFEERILIFMRAHPPGTLQTEDIAKHFDYTVKAMRVRLDDLKEEGRVKLVGKTASSNLWQVTGG